MPDPNYSIVYPMIDPDKVKNITVYDQFEEDNKPWSLNEESSILTQKSQINIIICDLIHKILCLFYDYTYDKDLINT